MLKLYKRDETLFAIACIVVYVVVFGNLRGLGDDNPFTTLGLLAYAAIALGFVMKNGLAERCGLTRWPQNGRELLYLVPLWVIASGNLWSGISPHYQGLGLVCALATMALVGVVEELVFRGFLFGAMLRSGSTTTAIVVSSVTFGIGHIVNLFTGQTSLDTFVQMGFAITMGFVFTLVYYRGGSLLPCIVAHSLIDMFSVISNDAGQVEWLQLAIIIALGIAYSIYLARIKTVPSNLTDAA